MCAFMTDGIFFATTFFSNILIPLCLAIQIGGGGGGWTSGGTSLPLPTQECLKLASYIF